MSSPCILLVYIWEFGAPPPSIYAMFPTCNFLLIFMIISLFSTVTFPVGKTALASWHARVDPEEAKGTIEALARGKDDDMLERLKRFAVGEFCVEVRHMAFTPSLPCRLLI
ncbi:hypothetical protein M427DRAFT_52011 [Gonapodya prolifera JEL478]|uniref:Uncharacterized protein n=1 Tax=Gonapodya prolifera (strain JEL478) TaxID=1344416 RepID=A0A139AUE7_GONPJ|nr:hypothetical protein M427DRAFT_52011 [Gonapodya prolifera JEL478]|eukprot:KXS20366.1 hypothetical protein M427DRAFT_52011 [Gonapodya prolifera JEL478]